jgi:hypothetical protein
MELIIQLIVGGVIGWLGRQASGAGWRASSESAARRS